MEKDSKPLPWRFIFGFVAFGAACIWGLSGCASSQPKVLWGKDPVQTLTDKDGKPEASIYTGLDEKGYWRWKSGPYIAPVKPQASKSK